MGKTFALRSLSPMGTWKPQSGRKGGLIERTPGRDERGIARRKRTPRGTEPGARAHRRGRGSATGRQEGVGPGAAGQAAEHPRPAGVVGVVAHEPFEHSAAGPAAGRLPVTRLGLHRLRGTRACRLFPRLSSRPRPDPRPLEGAGSLLLSRGPPAPSTVHPIKEKRWQECRGRSQSPPWGRACALNNEKAVASERQQACP